MPLLSRLRPRHRAPLPEREGDTSGARDHCAADPHDHGRRELAVRVASGIRVVLSWRPTHDDVVVSVDDSRTGERFELEVARDRALHAFHHPFAYAA
jgi:hypothetical protein